MGVGGRHMARMCLFELFVTPKKTRGSPPKTFESTEVVHWQWYAVILLVFLSWGQLATSSRKRQQVVSCGRDGCQRAKSHCRRCHDIVFVLPLVVAWQRKQRNQSCLQKSPTILHLISSEGTPIDPIQALVIIIMSVRPVITQ